jgi:ribonuclease HIII
LKKIDCYKEVKAKLKSKGYKVEDQKLIQDGLQFNVLKGKKYLIRLFESKKKGITADFSQIDDERLKSKLEKLTVDVLDKYDRKKNSRSVGKTIKVNESIVSVVVDYLEGLGAEKVEQTEDYVLAIYKHLSLTITIYKSGKVRIQGRVYVDNSSFYDELLMVVEGKKVDSISKDVVSKEDEASSLVVEGGNTDNRSDVGSSFRPGLKRAGVSSNRRKSNGLIGVDESGKGSFYGPLVIAAVHVDTNTRKKLIDLGVRDSKDLEDYKIREYAQKIKEWCEFQVINIDSAAYNRGYKKKFGSLNKILGWGHAAALERVLKKVNCKNALSDKFGKESDVENYLTEISSGIHIEYKTKAESNIAVAAASILARDRFVRGIEDLSNKYGFKFPKGYNEDNVLELGKKFVNEYGEAELKEVAKTHFITAKEILKSTRQNLFGLVS